jgi:hypothetical protein
MELHADVPVPDRECLVMTMNAGRDQPAPARHAEGFVVPLKHRRAGPAEPVARERIVLGFDVRPSDFDMSGRAHLPAERAAHQLTTQAMTEHRHVGAQCFQDQPFTVAQRLPVVVHAHRSAQQAKAAKCFERSRCGVTVEKLEHAYRHATGAQVCAEEADSAVLVVLQDRNRLHKKRDDGEFGVRGQARGAMLPSREPWRFPFERYESCFWTS